MVWKELKMRFRTLPSVVTMGILLSGGLALAQDDSVRAMLMGKWEQSDGEHEAKTTWILESTGSSIHVSNSSDQQVVAEFDCNTMGKECAIKHAGHASKVSFYFNGPKLVELETMGSQVVKRRFTVTSDGDAMELETIPIVPGGSTETTHFKRVAATVSQGQSTSAARSSK
jgi:hypothetical protein